ncbi:DUF2283 domain-containing protein [Dehalococcoidia bacterium]|nr:DUF2283 domain-containing protein [Dehalococcoidia bacterium]
MKNGRSDVPGKKVAETVTIAPGVHVDFSAEKKLVGIEVIDASEVLGKKFEFGMELSPLESATIGSR